MLSCGNLSSLARLTLSRCICALTDVSLGGRDFGFCAGATAAMTLTARLSAMARATGRRDVMVSSFLRSDSVLQLRLDELRATGRTDERQQLVGRRPLLRQYDVL